MSSFQAPSSVPVGVDPTRASIARVYDYGLGGKDNYPVDREVLDKVDQLEPGVKYLARSNRDFLIRAVRFLALEGLDQFLDCGSGLPTAENTHQVVARVNPDARVQYVDNDPVVIAHGHALLDGSATAFFAEADIFQPAALLSNSAVQSHIDFSRPLVLLHAGTLHHYIDDNVADMMTEYYSALPSGSYVVMSHFFNPENELSSLARQIEDIFIHSPMGSGRFRTTAELLAILHGLEIVPPFDGGPPGTLAECDNWWPDGPHPGGLNRFQRCIAGAVARVP